MTVSVLKTYYKGAIVTLGMGVVSSLFVGGIALFVMFDIQFNKDLVMYFLFLCFVHLVMLC